MKSRAIDRVGQFIVFEGVDGVGKTTLAESLLRTLRRDGIPCLGASFPGREPGTLAAHIYRLYHNPHRFAVRSINHEAIQLLLTAAHIEVIQSKVLPALRRGRTVVLDRFWWSTWVYGQASGVSGPVLKSLLAVEDLAWAGVVPTMVFLVTRRNAGRRRESRKVDAQSRLVSLYKSLARREASLGKYQVSILANDASISEAVQTVRSRLQRRRTAPMSSTRFDTPSKAKPKRQTGKSVRKG